MWRQKYVGHVLVMVNNPLWRSMGRCKEQGGAAVRKSVRKAGATFWARKPLSDVCAYGDRQHGMVSHGSRVSQVQATGEVSFLQSSRLGCSKLHLLEGTPPGDAPLVKGWEAGFGQIHFTSLWEGGLLMALPYIPRGRKIFKGSMLFRCSWDAIWKDAFRGCRWTWNRDSQDVSGAPSRRWAYAGPSGFTCPLLACHSPGPVSHSTFQCPRTSLPENKHR